MALTNCLLTSGYTLNCRNIAGVQAIYIGTWNGASMTYGATADGSIISFGGATVSFYTFQQDLEQGSFVDAGQYSVENGTAFYEQTCEITVTPLTQALSNQIATLGQGRWRILILDQQGLYWLMGKTNPVSVSAATPGLGKAYGDLHGAVITFTGKEQAPIVQVSSAAALTLIV